MTKARFVWKGGKGSGDFGHAGRPGKVGGSSGGGGGSAGGAAQAPTTSTTGGTPVKIRELEENLSVDYIKKGAPTHMKRNYPSVARAVAQNPNAHFFARSYFYSGGNDENTFIENVQAQASKAGFIVDVLEKGNHWHAFVGGAEPGSAKDSFWWFVANVTKNG